MNKSKQWQKVRDMAVFAMLGTLMFLSKLLMEFLPNVHMLALLVCVYTLVYRVRALIPIYIFVFLTGIYGGFNLWWVPYLYLWTVLWAVFLLLPKQMPMRVAAIVCPVICGLHGLLYGTLYAPMQALMFGYSWKQTLAWIAAGLPWDAVHGAGNLAMGTLVVPLVLVLERLEKRTIFLKKKQNKTAEESAEKEP